MDTPRTTHEAVAVARQLMQDDPTTCKRGYTLDNAAYAVGTVFGFNVADIARELHDDDRRRAYDLIGGGNPHTLGTPRAGVTNEH